MAIVRFQQPSGSTSLANFFEWLNEHKEGTFLEDLTITNTTTVNTNDTLSIADDDVTIKFTVQSGSNKELFRYSSDDFTKVLKTERMLQPISWEHCSATTVSCCNTTRAIARRHGATTTVYALLLTATVSLRH